MADVESEWMCLMMAEKAASRHSRLACVRLAHCQRTRNAAQGPIPASMSLAPPFARVPSAPVASISATWSCLTVGRATEYRSPPLIFEAVFSTSSGGATVIVGDEMSSELYSPGVCGMSTRCL
jgi:hypothetical protein